MSLSLTLVAGPQRVVYISASYRYRVLPSYLLHSCSDFNPFLPQSLYVFLTICQGRMYSILPRHSRFLSRMLLTVRVWKLGMG
jgi:hypothetical protein